MKKDNYFIDSDFHAAHSRGRAVTREIRRENETVICRGKAGVDWNEGLVGVGDGEDGCFTDSDFHAAYDSGKTVTQEIIR